MFTLKNFALSDHFIRELCIIIWIRDGLDPVVDLYRSIAISNLINYIKDLDILIPRKDSFIPKNIFHTRPPEKIFSTPEEDTWKRKRTLPKYFYFQIVMHKFWYKIQVYFPT
jgi:hypothetical protein